MSHNLTVAQNPLLDPFRRQDITVITDPGKPTIEILVKKGEKIVKYKACDEIGQGEGEKVGIAYRMRHGSLIYVPEGQDR